MKKRFEFNDHPRINMYTFSQALSKLRVSSHRLQIEAGRLVRPHSIPVNDRKCVVCQVLDDECHFVLECRMYTELRRTYIPKHYWHRPSMFKFVELINTSNTRYLKK